MEIVSAALTIDRDHKDVVAAEVCIRAPIPPPFNSLNLKLCGFGDFAEFLLTDAVAPARCKRFAVSCEKSVAVEAVAELRLFDSCFGALLRRRSIYCWCSAIQDRTAGTKDKCCRNN